MSKIKNITWEDMRTHRKLPNRKRNLLTDNFFINLKSELEHIFKKKDMTYWDIVEISETYGFYEAFKNTCKKYNIKKAIYDFYNRHWYDGYFIVEEITNLMLNRKMVREGNIDDSYNDEEIYEQLKNDSDVIFFKIIKPYKGYNVIEIDWSYKDNFEEYIKNYKKSGYIIESIL